MRSPRARSASVRGRPARTSRWPGSRLGLLGHAGDGGVESHAGLHADHQQVEDVRERVDDRSLTDLDAVAEPEVGQEETDPGENERNG